MVWAARLVFLTLFPVAPAIELSLGPKDVLASHATIQSMPRAFCAVFDEGSKLGEITRPRSQFAPQVNFVQACSRNRAFGWTNAVKVA